MKIRQLTRKLLGEERVNTLRLSLRARRKARYGTEQPAAVTGTVNGIFASAHFDHVGRSDIWISAQLCQAACSQDLMDLH